MQTGSIMMDPTPFKQDIDELVDEFIQGNFTTLADMKRVWMTKRFSYIHEARPTTDEAVFVQSLFAHSINHMVSPGDLSRRLGGLYCLHCLYETQPYKPCFKIYLSLGELKKLRTLVVDAKENGIEVVPALVKRMLDRNVFLFGSVDIDVGSLTNRVDEIMKLQNRRIQIAYEKLFADTEIEKYVHADLGADMGIEALKKMSTEYSEAMAEAIKGANNKVNGEDLKQQLSENRKPVGDFVADIAEHWNVQKEAFYEQTSISPHNEIVTYKKLKQDNSSEQSSDPCFDESAPSF